MQAVDQCKYEIHHGNESSATSLQVLGSSWSVLARSGFFGLWCWSRVYFGFDFAGLAGSVIHSGLVRLDQEFRHHRNQDSYTLWSFSPSRIIVIAIRISYTLGLSSGSRIPSSSQSDLVIHSGALLRSDYHHRSQDQLYTQELVLRRRVDHHRHSQGRLCKLLLLRLRQVDHHRHNLGRLCTLLLVLRCLVFRHRHNLDRLGMGLRCQE